MADLGIVALVPRSLPSRNRSIWMNNLCPRMETTNTEEEDTWDVALHRCSFVLLCLFHFQRNSKKVVTKRDDFDIKRCAKCIDSAASYGVMSGFRLICSPSAPAFSLPGLNCLFYANYLRMHLESLITSRLMMLFTFNTTCPSIGKKGPVEAVFRWWVNTSVCGLHP